MSLSQELIYSPAVESEQKKQALILETLGLIDQEESHFRLKIADRKNAALKDGADLHKIAYDIKLSQSKIDELKADAAGLCSKTVEELDLIIEQLQNKVNANYRENNQEKQATEPKTDYPTEAELAVIISQTEAVRDQPTPTTVYKVENGSVYRAVYNGADGEIRTSLTNIDVS